MTVNLKQLETFVWVADLGSFRRAATRLNTTQPNISSRISSLETSLGTVLMERDAGSVRLTSRGDELLDYAREVLRSMEAFLEAAGDPNLFDGVLRLGVTEMVVSTWLREFLQVLKVRFPNTLVELKVDLSATLERDLDDHSIDLALQSGPFTKLSTGNHHLGTFPIVWVASAEICRSLNGRVTIDQLLEFPVITHARSTRPYVELNEHFATRQDLKARLIPSSNLSSCVNMVIDGLGVAALLLPLVEDHISQGKLSVIDYEWVPQPLSFHARYDIAKSSNVVKHAATLASELSNRFAKRFAE